MYNLSIFQHFRAVFSASKMSVGAAQSHRALYLAAT